MKPYAGDRILYIENLKTPPKKLLELINELSKITGYEFNTEKFIAFLYINNELSEFKRAIPFVSA